jgi:hypothetical protein
VRSYGPIGRGTRQRSKSAASPADLGLKCQASPTCTWPEIGSASRVSWWTQAWPAPAGPRKWCRSTPPPRKERLSPARPLTSAEPRSKGREGRTVASPGITVGTGLDHIQDMLRAGLIHRAAEKEGVLGKWASGVADQKERAGVFSKGSPGLD